MKKIFLSFLQFFFFLGVYLIGTLLDPFHLKWLITHPTPSSERYFVPDGLLLMLALCALILLVETLTSRLRTMRLVTIVALALALVLGLLAKFGFAQHDLF